MFYRNCCSELGDERWWKTRCKKMHFKKGRILYEETQTRRMFALVAFSLHPPTTSIYVRTARQQKKYKKIN